MKLQYKCASGICNLSTSRANDLKQKKIKLSHISLNVFQGYRNEVAETVKQSLIFSLTLTEIKLDTKLVKVL